MRRRWIMVELGDHCETHVVPRLEKVVDGTDPGGITELADWKGGGGFRYFRLAPSLLEKDQFDQWVISKAYNGEMLAEAMCTHFGFTYSPSDEHYWLHGHSSETDFIYVTTNSLTHEQLQAISDEVGDKRTLLICCKAFQGTNADKFTNLTIRKIPGAILDRCEWGKDDYSLKIEALPLIDDEPEPQPEPEAAAKARGRPRKADDAPSLFDQESDA
jgi:adenine-specific DNA-methyltransferase